ncbi:MAG: class I SAM-dependent methyltransferase [Xanthomonadales bacterium]|nr:class I SAM-dependent methyltransferase [Xanthomonadales bacterium]
MSAQSQAAPAHGQPRPHVLRSRVLATLAALREGCLTLVEDGHEQRLGAVEGSDPLHVRVSIRRPAAWRALALGGSIGAAESYADGDWECDDLVALVRLLVRNRDLLDRMDGGLVRLAGWLWERLSPGRRNTRAGSRRNIAAHYDLGNRLFSLFLDDSLMYSSAVYARPDETLAEASTRKLERICAKLELGPDDHVVEIGSGWGGFAIHAASRHGCRVTTTTISREQFALASGRVREAGLADRVEVLLSDYRDLRGRYDKLVSIEMIEAVGADFLDTYMAKVSSLLAPDGMALIQAITIEEHRYRRALRTLDFIKKHIFPGSFIPALTPIMQAVTRSTDLKLFNLEDIGPSYALTLRAWRERFNGNLAQARALGYDERFCRMWTFYLAYCEGGFLERALGDVQLLLTKPGCRRLQFLPDLAVEV